MLWRELDVEQLVSVECDADRLRQLNDENRYRPKLADIADDMEIIADGKGLGLRKPFNYDFEDTERSGPREVETAARASHLDDCDAGEGMSEVVRPPPGSYPCTTWMAAVM